MKQAIIIGTNHYIQEGRGFETEYKAYITEIVRNHKIKAIGEEIRDDRDFSVAKNVCEDLGIAHKIIDPNPEKYEELGITPIHEIEYFIMTKYDLDKSPLYRELTPPEAIVELQSIMREKHSSIREHEWLRRLLTLDTWPVLVICGSDHFEYFSRLLSENNISVIKNASNWSG